MSTLAILLLLRRIPVQGYSTNLGENLIEVDETAEYHDILHPEQEIAVLELCTVILKVQELCYLAVRFYISFQSYIDN